MCAKLNESKRETKVKTFPVSRSRVMSEKRTYHDFSDFIFLPMVVLRRKVHSSVVGASEISPLPPSSSSSASSIEQESASCNTRCSLSRRTVWCRGLIYVAVWVHRYFLHGRGPLHAGHLPSITDSTFSNFAGIRARICVASSSSQVQNVDGRFI